MKKFVLGCLGIFLSLMLTACSVGSQNGTEGEKRLYPTDEPLTFQRYDEIEREYIVDFHTEGKVVWYDHTSLMYQEMAVPKERGILRYYYENELIFQNTETGGCYRSDWEGNLLESFECADVIGFDFFNWLPLPDFSGVLYDVTMDGNGNYIDDYLILWDKMTGTGELLAPRDMDWMMQPALLSREYILLLGSDSEGPGYWLYDLQNRAFRTVFREDWFCGYSHDKQYLYFREGFYSSDTDRFFDLSDYTEDEIVDNGYFIYGGTLCFFTSGEDMMQYKTVEMDTGKVEAYRTDIPSDIQYLRIEKITADGSCIIHYRVDDDTTVTAVMEI